MLVLVLMIVLMIVLVLSLKSGDLFDLGFFLDNQNNRESPYNNRSGIFFSHI